MLEIGLCWVYKISGEQQSPQPATTVIYSKDEGTNVIIRFLWMIFIGWWLSGLFYFAAIVLTALIIPAPIGMMVMQKTGWAFSLYEDKKDKVIVQQGQNVTIYEGEDINFILRFVYFYFIGWWVGLIAMFIAWILGITIIGLPASILIMNRLGKITTLAA